MLVPQGLQSAFEDTGIQAESHEFMESHYGPHNLCGTSKIPACYRIPQCGWIDDGGALHGQAKAPTAGEEAYGLWAKVVQMSSEVLPCHRKLTGH